MMNMECLICQSSLKSMNKGHQMKTKAFIALILGLFLHTNLNANDAANPCGALLCILGGQTSGECKKYYNYYAYELPKSCKGNAACIAAKQIQHLKNCKMESAPANLPVNNTYSSNTTQFINNLDSKINEASQLSGECTKAELNRVESKVLRKERICDSEGYCRWKESYGYRINPTPTKTCQILTGQEYSVLKITYTCPKTFYEKEDWDNGYTKQIISKAVYESLASKDRGTYLSYEKVSMATYEKLPKNEKRIIYKYKINANGDKVIERNDNGDMIIERYEKIITNYYKKNYIKKDCWVVEERQFG